MSRITARAINNWHVALFIFCSILLNRDALTRGMLFAESDTYEFYAPLARLVGDTLHAGRFPWWTSAIYGGYPLYADGETAMFYPPHVLYAVAPPVFAFVALRVFTYVVACWSMYCFCRSLDQGTWASTLGGLSFGFGSFSVGQMQHVNLLDCAALLPLVLANLEYALRHTGRERLRRSTLAGAVCGLQALTPHSSVLLITALGAVLYVLLRVAMNPSSAIESGDESAPLRSATRWLGRRHLFGGRSHDARVRNASEHPGIVGHQVLTRVRSLAQILGLTALIGGTVGAVQLLPLAALAAESQRGEGVSYAYATAFAIPPPNVITVIWPYFFRAGDGTYWSPWFRWDTTLYLGVAPFVLACVALALPRGDRKARSREIALGLLGITGLFIAFGDMTPVKLFGLLWHLPIFSTQRAPSRYLLLTGIALAALAGFGLDRVREQIATRVWRSTQWVLALGALAGGCALTTSYVLVTRHPVAARKLLLAPYQALGNQQTELHTPANTLAALVYSLRPTSRWTAFGLVFLAATLLILAAWRRWQTSGPTWQAALVFLATLDLLVFAHDFHPLVPFDNVWGLAPAGYAIAAAHTNRHYTLWPAAETAPDKLAPFGLQDAAGYTSLEPAAHAYLASALRANVPAALDLLGVESLVVPTRTRAGTASDDVLYTDADVTITRRSGNHPRAWLVTSAEYTNQEQALADVAASRIDVYHTVLLDMDTQLKKAPEAPVASSPSADAERSIALDDRGDQIAIRASVTASGWLVLADLWYPGWTATIDGAPAPLLRADGLVRAVALTPGDHTVEFAYHERWLLVGAALSVCGFVLVLLVLFLPAKSFFEKGYS